jgi:prepilin-type N-terminal cleavage/methylation domain-containing protein
MAFTLIELLVVVAIIALLIAILLPSLSKARAQARTTMCLSRISQFGKAFLMYAEDYDGMMPFNATGHGGTTDPNEIWHTNWLAAPDPTGFLEIVVRQPEDSWPVGAAYPEMIRSGMLFRYARFEGLYRCPEFERVRNPLKYQSRWNYTRAIWGRLWRIYREEMELYGEASSDWGGVEYEIMKVDRICSPATLPVILDEQWDRHVAVGDYYGTDGSGYVGADYMFNEANIMGLYHGQKTTSRFHDRDYAPGYVPFLWPRGGICCYDGHAELERDPWPTYELGSGYEKRTRTAPKEFRTNGAGKSGFDEIYAIQQYMMMLCYAQRCFDPIEKYSKPPAPW